MNLELQTQRLRLTPFSPQDEDLAMELFTNPTVTQYADGTMTREKIRNEIPNWVRRGGNGCIGIWCIAHQASGEKLGSIALLPIPIEADDTDFSLVIPDVMPDGDVEIGFFLKPNAWGQGFASEACARILRFAFEDSPPREVVATFDDDNHASENVLSKAGFVNCGRRLCYGEDGPDYRIKREDWLMRDDRGST